jgi:hypothetical protein
MSHLVPSPFSFHCIDAMVGHTVFRCCAGQEEIACLHAAEVE